MPELPEVESVRRSLEPHLLGRTIVRATLRRADMLERSGHPASRAMLSGAVIASTARRGKQLALIAGDGRTLCIQLGMSGQLLHEPKPGRTLAHTHALWTLDDGSRLLFRDPRRFGGLTATSTLDALAHRWHALGPDAATIRPADLLPRLRATRRILKVVLLDQRTLAGVGNIYADESLFAGGLSPRRPANKVTNDECRRLCRAIRATLASAIRSGGTTLRDYRAGDGSRGTFQNRLAVYGRATQPCSRCSRPLSSTRVAQRATVYCVACQS